MRTSDRGVMALIIHEGIVPGPYRCSAGVLTYGIGHTAAAGYPNPANLPRGMPKDLGKELRRVFEVFRNDLIKFEREVLQHVKVPLKQHEFDALVSFHFNTGGIARAALTRHLNAGNRKAAAEAFMGWSRPSEIIPRRREEQKLFATGHYPTGRATVWQVDANYRVIWRPVRTLSPQEVMALIQPRSLTESRTIKGTGLAGASTVGVVATEAAQEMAPLLPYADSLKWAFVALTLVGIGFAMYARIDDWKKGRK
jgi:lysozyme